MVILYVTVKKQTEHCMISISKRWTFKQKIKYSVPKTMLIFDITLFCPFASSSFAIKKIYWFVNTCYNVFPLKLGICHGTDSDCSFNSHVTVIKFVKIEI
jgi:hypothetical protein